MVVEIKHQEKQAWRCASCGRLLAKVVLAPGSSIEAKCPKCDRITELVVAQAAR